MKYFLMLLFAFPFAIWSDTPPMQGLIDMQKIFSSSPFIYGALGLMSIASLAIWLYTLATFRTKDIMTTSGLATLRSLLAAGEWEKAKETCSKQPNLLSSIVYAGLTMRELGPAVMIDAMKAEGKRASTPFWQRLALLNDIAMVAPMLGLLGTVIGMFYAFYDVNRSIESINALFDGLGIAVGTTVAGLIVAILSMVFATTLKYRLVKTLSHVETEAVVLSALIPGS
ncbi:MAG TPA: MotA/TolQ/ExbB proton channel family protein [Chlamydiales bacterium]|nr:MotA/TolQ/ExbB proton channel family protein [Chlamydiales bacterium]